MFYAVRYGDPLVADVRDVSLLLLLDLAFLSPFRKVSSRLAAPNGFAHPLVSLNPTRLHIGCFFRHMYKTYNQNTNPPTPATTPIAPPTISFKKLVYQVDK